MWQEERFQWEKDAGTLGRLSAEVGKGPGEQDLDVLKGS